MRPLNLLLAVCVLAACTSPPAPAATPVLGVTPTAGASSTASMGLPATATPGPPQPVSITTDDGAALPGVLYGGGDTAVIFSVMGDCVGDWTQLAQAAADQGLMALTYQWRACEPGSVNGGLLSHFVDDLRSAIAFVREMGAARVILAGASLGGVASAKLLAEAEAVGLVVVAAPADVPSLNASVTAADLDRPVPKLFITAEADAVVDPADTRALHDLAAEPKAWQTYPGRAHGTHLFATESGAEAQQRILAFILAAAAP